MAKKLNRNLIGGLTAFGMILIAAAGFVLLANLPGHDPKLYETQAKEYIAKGDYNRAGQAFMRAYQRDPQKNPDYLVEAAKCALEEGSYRDARDLLATARVKDPLHRAATEMSVNLELEMAKQYGGSQLWNRVLSESQKLAKINEQSVISKTSLALAYSNLEGEDSTFSEKARIALDEANRADPGNTDVIEAMAKKRVAQILQKSSSGARDDSRKMGEDLINMMSQSVNRITDKNSKQYFDLKRNECLVRVLIGSVRANVNKALVEEGMKCLEMLASEDKTSPESAILLAMTKAGQITPEVKQDLPAAESLLEKATDQWPDDSRAYSGLAQVLQIERAQEKQESKRVELYEKEGAVYRKALDKVQRSKHFRKARDNYFRALFFRELFMLEINKLRAANVSEEKKKEALAAAQNWIDKIKEEVDSESVIVRFMVASIANMKGELIPAIKEAEAADRQFGASDDLLLQMLLADLYMQQRQWGNAKKALEKAVRLRRDSGVLVLSLARVYLSTNQPAMALAALKTSSPESVRTYLETNEDAIRARVEAYRQMNQFQLAQEESKKLKDQGPDAIVRDARLLILDQHFKEAEEMLKGAIDKNPGDENAVRVLVQMYDDTNRLSDARKLLDTLVSSQPKNRVYRGMQLNYMEGDAAKKDEQMLTFLQEEPDELAREISIGDYYSSRQKYEESIKHLDLAEQKAPKDPGVVDRQLRVAMAASNWDRAGKYALRDGELNLDGTEGKIAQGRLALARKETDKAIELMRAGLVIYPSYSMGWTYLAEAYLIKGNRAEAKSALLKALEIDPTNAYANRGMADLAMREGDDKGAEKYLDAASVTLKNEPWIKKTQQILKEKGNPQEGIQFRENLRKEKPENLENLVLLARLYGDPKVAQYDKATETYRDALKVSNNDLILAKEFAIFLGREDVNRPSEGEALLSELLRKETDKSKRAQISVALGQFCENQKQLATADRHFRFAVEIEPTPEVLDAIGQFCARTNRFKEAVDYYKRLLDQAKDDPKIVQATRSRICALLLAMGDLDEAKKRIDDYVQTYPDDSEGIIYEGAYHRIGGDIQKAKQAFDRQLQRQPDNAVALWQRGQLNMLQGRWQAAVDDLQKAKAYSPDGFMYQHRIALANALLETDQAGQAIAELKSILEIKPEEDSVAEAMVDAYCRVSPPRYSDAENLIVVFERKRPKEYKWYLLQGQIAEKKPNNFAKAAEAYEKAAEIGRFKPEIIRQLFKAYKSGNMPQSIITYADTKLSTRMLASMPLELAALGWAYWRQGQMDQALERFDQAMYSAGQDFITYSRVINEMIACLGKQKTLERVNEQSQKDPENVEKQKALVHMLNSDGKQEEAIAVCDKVIKLAVRDEDRVFALVGQGMLLEQLKRYDEAKAKYEAALKINAEEPTALNNLAYLLVDRMKKPREALPYAEQANRLKKRSDSNVLDTLGWVQAENNLLREAAGTLLRALEMDRENLAVQYHLGLVHRRLGEIEEAKGRLKSAQRLGKSQDDKEFLPKITQELMELENAGK